MDCIYKTTRSVTEKYQLTYFLSSVCLRHRVKLRDHKQDALEDCYRSLVA